MTTLTEKAKEAPKRTIHKITSEVVELAVAWAKEEISITQVKKVLKVSENNKAYSILARALKEKIKKSLKKVEVPAVQEPPVPPPAPATAEVKPEINDKKEPANSPSLPDIAPGRY